MYRQMFMPGNQFQPIPGQTFEMDMPGPTPAPVPAPYMGYPTLPVYEMGTMYPAMPTMYPTMDQIYMMLQETYTMLQRIYDHETQTHV